MTFAASTTRLLTWEECASFEIDRVHALYREYVNSTQVDMMSAFGFGRTVATHAEGMYIHTRDGRRILDFTGGVGVLNHGHNHPRLLAARTAFQQQKRMEVHKNFLSPYVAGLSHNIAQLMPADLKVSYFCNSGAEAVEGAVKLAYKYFQGTRKHVLRADISFHGKLLGSGGLTASPELNFRFPTIPGIETFEYNNIESVREHVRRLRRVDGTSDVYAVLLEPMNASSLRECSTEFLTALRDLCTREQIILIFDEVYTGWGKTGEIFYFMRHGVVPDIVTSSKSFGGGKSSISCYITRTPIFRKAYDNLNDAILHSTTYNGFGEECVTAIEAINVLVEDDYPGRARRIHERLQAGLRRLQQKHPDLVDEVRGCGALHGVLLNKELNAVLQKAISVIPAQFFRDERLIAKLITSSVIAELYTAHGILTFYGSNREIPLIVSPSLIVTDEEIDRFVNSLDQVLAAGKYALLLKFVKSRFLKH